MPTVAARDGTRLAVQVVGATQPSGPDLVLVNGLGGTFDAWVHLVHRFEAQRRILSWDYRGLYGSGPPARRDAVRIENHVDDLFDVLDAVGSARSVLVGWSMGVQVAVEGALARPDRIAGLVAVCGSPGDPHTTVLGWAPMRRVLPVATRLVEWNRRPFGVALRGLTRLPAPEILRAAHVVAPVCDLDVFRGLAHEFAHLDWGVYMRTARVMGEHTAWPRLGELRVPTLVIGGTKDKLTPPKVAADMAAAVPGARLVLVRGATHYAPVEYPDEICAGIEDFLADLPDSGRAPHRRPRPRTRPHARPA